MPRVNIYIRQEDWDTWQLIPDKPQWLRARLGEIDEPPMPRVRAYDKKPLNKASKDYSLCPHGSIKGFCKKGCR